MILKLKLLVSVPLGVVTTTLPVVAAGSHVGVGDDSEAGCLNQTLLDLVYGTTSYTIPKLFGPPPPVVP